MVYLVFPLNRGAFLPVPRPKWQEFNHASKKASPRGEKQEERGEKGNLSLILALLSENLEQRRSEWMGNIFLQCAK